MNNFPGIPYAARHLLTLLLCAGLALPSLVPAGTVDLATAPLATSTTTSVKPNLLFVLDNSLSMDWENMPDQASDPGSKVVFVFGHYGLRSNQCNQVYYDPTFTYTPPIKADGTTYYNNASFSGAWTDGFSTSTTPSKTDLRTAFSVSGETGQTAYYYSYSGSQTTSLQKNYHSTTNDFYKECSSAQNASPGQEVFTKVVITDAATSTTAKLTLGCSSCTSTSVSSIKIDGVEAISGASTGHSSTSTAATNIAAKITLNGFSATASSNVVTISGLPESASTIVITKASGNMYFAPTIYQKADAAKKTNFANWYSYYRTRFLMMKTATGHAFKSLNNKYRVGLMKISSSSTPVVGVGTFEGTGDTEQRGKWYKELYGMSSSGSTPLRTFLTRAATSQASFPGSPIRSSIPASRISSFFPPMVTGTMATRSTSMATLFLLPTTRMPMQHAPCTMARLPPAPAQ
jgi:type IV pilus assembly protein PilY1